MIASTRVLTSSSTIRGSLSSSTSMLTRALPSTETLVSFLMPSRPSTASSILTARPSSASSGVAPRRGTETLIVSGSDEGNISIAVSYESAKAPPINTDIISKFAATSFRANHAIISRLPLAELIYPHLSPACPQSWPMSPMSPDLTAS